MNPIIYVSWIALQSYDNKGKEERGTLIFVVDINTNLFFLLCVLVYHKFKAMHIVLGLFQDVTHLTIDPLWRLGIRNIYVSLYGEKQIWMTSSGVWDGACLRGWVVSWVGRPSLSTLYLSQMKKENIYLWWAGIFVSRSIELEWVGGCAWCGFGPFLLNWAIN